MTLLFDDGGGGEYNLNRNILENGFRHNFLVWNRFEVILLILK